MELFYMVKETGAVDTKENFELEGYDVSTLSKVLPASKTLDHILKNGFNPCESYNLDWIEI